MEEIELLVLPPGKRIRMRSGATGRSIGEGAQVAVIGGPFASRKQARDAAEKAKRALLCWATEHRVGIDFGDGKQRSGATKAYLAILQKQYGCPVRNDIHGVDIYEHAAKPIFVSVRGKATVGKDPRKLVDTFQREYLHTRHLTEKQVLASEIYSSSFFDVSPRSRFITLVTAVEALLERTRRANEVEALLEEFKAKTEQSPIQQSTRDSIVRSLEQLKHESIGQAGRALANRLIPSDLFDGQSSADFFSHCYNLRSQILHRGKIEDESLDVLYLANIMEGFVAKLLLAVLNSAPQDNSGADNGN
jgi:hypothetical protein